MRQPEMYQNFDGDWCIKFYSTTIEDYSVIGPFTDKELCEKAMILIKNFMEKKHVNLSVEQ